MSSSLKTLAFRWPNPAAPSLARCCSLVAPSTARPVCLIQQSTFYGQRQPAASAHAWARPNHNLAAATRIADAALLPRHTVRKPTASSVINNKRSYATSAEQISKAAQGTAQSALDWDSFFKLRLRRRRIQVVFSVASCLVGGAGGAIFLSTGVAEPIVMQVPLDPFMTLGFMTMACMAMGWLVGPSIGNQVFYLTNRRLKAQMMQKESQFFARVRKNRVDPSNSSAGNPVPDFYGEKIQSVSGYRQWLKDQRAFNKKKTRAFV